jgi:phosphoribosyl 1,2-cyclic phosphodiesterase
MSGCDMFDCDDDYFESYKFSYTSEGRKISYEVTEDVNYWPDVLDKFLDFLSSVYGYNIRKSVTVTEPSGHLNFSDTNEDTTT